MVDPKQLESIPRGNTAPGVNRAVIEHLFSVLDRDSTESLLDIPCGKGEFLNAVKTFYPDLETHGADIIEPRDGFGHHFARVDGGQLARDADSTKFRIATCISGVMEFDNTLSFFEGLRERMEAGGELIVSNDNLLSVRDRILYLLFGRHRQYKMSIPFDAPTWKVLPLQNLLRILFDAGFEIVGIRYVPPKSSDWVWFPLAALLFPIQYLYMRSNDDGQENGFTRAMFPFISLLSRHYFVVCRVRSK